MKSSFKGTGKQIVANPVHDTLPQDIFAANAVHDNSDNYWSLPSDPLDPAPEMLIAAEQDFRCFINSRLPQPKTPAYLLERIRHAVRRIEKD